MSVTVITGGVGTLGLTVDNSATSGSDDLNYSVSPSAVTGVSYGAVTPTPAAPVPMPLRWRTLFSDDQRADTAWRKHRNHHGDDPDAVNSPQTLDVTLTVLGHWTSNSSAIPRPTRWTWISMISSPTVESPISLQIENLTAAFEQRSIWM